MRSRSVVLPLLTALAASVTACSQTQPQEVGEICVDTSTGTRVDDSRCPDHGGSGGVHWMYWPYGSGRPAPAIGMPATGAAAAPPAGARVYRPAGTGGYKGTPVTRGGFGGRANTGS